MKTYEVRDTKRLRERPPFSWFRDDYFGGPSLLGFISAVLAGAAVLAVVICLITAGVGSASCGQKGERLGVHTSYRFLTGCYVELPSGRQIPDDLYPPKYIHVQGVGK